MSHTSHIRKSDITDDISLDCNSFAKRENVKKGDVSKCEFEVTVMECMRT